MMIREYKTTDSDTLIAIWRAASAVAHSFLPDAFMGQVEQDMRNIYLPGAETWVLEKSEKQLGFIALVGNEIGGLFLDPEAHGQGYGRAMVDHAALIKGALCVEVFEQNSIGRRFYDGYGFVETERYDHEPSGQWVIRMAVPNAA